MSRAGRPLRFVALVTMAWVGGRVWMLWPHAVAEVIPIGTPAQAEAAVAPQSHNAVAPVGTAVSVVRPADGYAKKRESLPGVAPKRLAPVLLVDLPQSPSAEPSLMVQRTSPAVFPRAEANLAPPAPQFNRWSGSAWALVRGSGTVAQGAGAASLGGSQAGVRIAYALDQHVALMLRATAPLSMRAGRELSAGIEWQPILRVPVRLVVERRETVDGSGNGGFGVGAVGGVADIALLGGFRLDAYGQAGVIARARTEPYVDGAVRVARPIATIGGTVLAGGVGAWGGAQRDAARLDLGPHLRATVPLGGQRVQLSLDWRQRVAGNARPGSGVVFGIGSDF